MGTVSNLFRNHLVIAFSNKQLLVSRSLTDYSKRHMGWKVPETQFQPCETLALSLVPPHRLRWYTSGTAADEPHQ